MKKIFCNNASFTTMDIFDAIDRHDIDKLKKILHKEKSYANAKRNNESALLVASELGYTDIMCLLIKYGAQVNMMNRSPLHAACEFGHLDAAVLLLEHGADPNTGCHIGNTPLHAASSFGNVKLIYALLNQDININAQNIDGWTPLHRAAHRGKIEAVKFLVNEGADISIKTNSGKTAFDFAVSMHFYNVAELLHKHIGCPQSKSTNLKLLLQTKKQQLREYISKPKEYKNRRIDNKENDTKKDVIPTIRVEKNTCTRFLEENLYEEEAVEISTRNDQAAYTSMKGKINEWKNNITTFTLPQNISTLIKNVSQGKNDVTNEVITDRDLDREHECPVCFEIPLPPTLIYQCINGHLYCGTCKVKPNMNNCPQCAVSIEEGGSRNRYAEENIKRIYKERIEDSE